MALRKLRSEGSLTASGLLYEGNFEEWQKRISATFIVRGKPELAYPATVFCRSEGKTYYHKSDFNDCWFIKCQVSPALLKRLPQHLFQLSVGELYAELKKFCRSFRLLDLPAELRLAILEDAFEGCKIEQRWATGMWSVRPSHRIPAFVRTNQKLREEALRLYFAHSNFVLRLQQGELGYSYNTFIMRLKQAVNNWSRIIARSSMADIRKLTLRIPFQQSIPSMQGGSQRSVRAVNQNIELTFSEKNGLEVALPDKATVGTKTKVKKYISDIEKRRPEGVKGESIVTACIENAGVWWYKSLWLEDE